MFVQRQSNTILKSTIKSDFCIQFPSYSDHFSCSFCFLPLHQVISTYCTRLLTYFPKNFVGGSSVENISPCLNCKTPYYEMANLTQQAQYLTRFNCRYIPIIFLQMISQCVQRSILWEPSPRKYDIYSACHNVIWFK